MARHPSSTPHPEPSQLSAPTHRLSRLSPRLVIPTCDRSREEKEQGWHHRQGLHLARQERWDDLSHLLRQFDGLRATTPGGTPIPTLLAQGARADTVSPTLPSGAPVTEARRLGVAALDALATDRADDYGTTLVAALAHIDIGWSFRGEGWSSEMDARDHESFARHFDRASELLDRFDPITCDSPALAAARCAALPGGQVPTDRLTAAYETLIALDPNAPGHMRAYGNHLLPRWFGSYDRLNLEARRTAAATNDAWGNGGYAWVYMDALLVDERAYEMLDTDFFLDGVRDILTRRPSQHLANLFAAYLGISTRAVAPKSGDARLIERARARLSAGFRWVLHDHLRELHPLLWAEAADRFAPVAGLPDRASLIRRGRAAAFSRISEAFAHVMAEGQIVRFDPDGIVYSPAA
ncbi:hypothetical protein ATO11_00070 [Pseudaestuariivita atlantica]|uniref:DUF4034 domain-containing protein n=1 Tax=Pseudaestuariivita atlantica TaxID=1317121 RepID=A0A0L1JVB5_9RHOB|nr:hypothetical protein ATO11_00070 [Pseudaestuariivita atlantica]